MATLFLIRHGETRANKLNVIQGTLDNELTELTPRGQQEAYKYQGLLTKYAIQRVFSSPLHRAMATSEIICQNSGVKLEVDRRLAEISYGKWNGVALANLKRDHADCFNNMTNDLSDNSSLFSQGESFFHARRRIRLFVQDIERHYPDERILVVTHGWIIKNLVAAYFPQVTGTAFTNPQNLSVTKVAVGTQPLIQRIYYYNRQLN